MNYYSNKYCLYIRLLVVFLASIAVLFVSCGSDKNSTDGIIKPPTQSENLTAPPSTQSSLPIPLNPHPPPTVALSVDTAVVTASAVYRAERLLTRFLQLNAELDKVVPREASTPGAALRLEANFCSSGEGLAQATDTSFAGVQQSVLIQLNECVAAQQSISGEITMSHYDDNGKDWLIIDASNINMQFDGESAVIVEGQLRLRQTEINGDTSLIAVGTSLDVVISGFVFNIAPFDSLVTLSNDSEVQSRHTVSITSELYGGLIFSKSSEPVLLAENGLTSSGGNTLRGMDSTVIEWSAGTTYIADSKGDSNTDVRDNNGRTVIESTWNEFLSAF